MNRRPKSRSGPPAVTADEGPLRLRIVGGSLRGRHLKYSGDQRVRPMKDRTREAVFNLLGPRVEGTYVWDLFAGTGAMGFEAISRGAIGASLIERHIPTSKLVRENAEALGLKAQVEIVQADAFFWMRQVKLPERVAREGAASPWLVFCCPPYALYEQELARVEQLVADLRRQSPPGSVLVMEAEIPFDLPRLMPDRKWQIREYAPAIVGIVECGCESPA